jgi:hypothetical protein
MYIGRDLRPTEIIKEFYSFHAAHSKITTLLLYFQLVSIVLSKHLVANIKFD